MAVGQFDLLRIPLAERVLVLMILHLLGNDGGWATSVVGVADTVLADMWCSILIIAKSRRDEVLTAGIES